MSTIFQKAFSQEALITEEEVLNYGSTDHEASEDVFTEIDSNVNNLNVLSDAYNGLDKVITAADTITPTDDSVTLLQASVEAILSPLFLSVDVPTLESLSGADNVHQYTLEGAKEIMSKIGKGILAILKRIRDLTLYLFDQLKKMLGGMDSKLAKTNDELVLLIENKSGTATEDFANAKDLFKTKLSVKLGGNYNYLFGAEGKTNPSAKLKETNSAIQKLNFNSAIHDIDNLVIPYIRFADGLTGKELTTEKKEQFISTVKPFELHSNFFKAISDHLQFEVDGSIDTSVANKPAAGSQPVVHGNNYIEVLMRTGGDSDPLQSVSYKIISVSDKQISKEIEIDSVSVTESMQLVTEARKLLKDLNKVSSSESGWKAELDKLIKLLDVDDAGYKLIQNLHTAIVIPTQVFKFWINEGQKTALAVNELQHAFISEIKAKA